MDEGRGGGGRFRCALMFPLRCQGGVPVSERASQCSVFPPTYQLAYYKNLVCSSSRNDTIMLEMPI